MLKSSQPCQSESESEKDCSLPGTVKSCRSLAPLPEVCETIHNDDVEKDDHLRSIPTVCPSL
jgi:hypothetical protein